MNRKMDLIGYNVKRIKSDHFKFQGLNKMLIN